MITSIRLVNFKNFADETLRVGPFTILVGANASGKSNIRDAFRFLHGIGRGYTLAEIFAGKYGPGGQLEWAPIRGAMNEIVRFEQPSFSLEIGLKLNGTELHYSIVIEHGIDKNTLRPDGTLRVQEEELLAESETVYTADTDHVGSLRVDAKELPAKTRVQSGQPALTQYTTPGRTQRLFNNQNAIALRSALASMRFPEPSPAWMREPSFPGAPLGDFGENLPTALQEIRTDISRQEILAGWLQELTPMDVEDFEFPLDPSGRTYLIIREKNGRRVSAYSASDGTLRFLTVLTALLGENPPGLYFFEEIDTGIHPARQWLLLELIEKQVAKHGIQVVATTHAPDFLTFVNDSTFEHLSVVGRLEDSQDAIIRPVAELPNAKKLRTSQGGLGRLLTSAWMEDMLAFTENHNSAEADGE